MRARSTTSKIKRTAAVALAWPGNRLVSTSVPKGLGLPIAPCVTQRKLKIDPATHELARRNAFKSRHCVDGGRLAQLMTRYGHDHHMDSTSTVASDLLFKMLIGDAADRDRNLLAADCPNAYPQGKRLGGRPNTYMDLPTPFKHWRADDGSELCIELTTPMWGEGPAGFEWQVELETTLRGLGWLPAENVPALWTFTGTDGDCLLITTVDDLLFSEAKSSGYTIAERTCAALSTKYGDVGATREPESHAGFKITRHRERGTITLSLPQKVVEAAREHLPELIEGKPTNAPTGIALRKLADAMRLPDERSAKLNQLQRRTQMLIGSLKFIEKVMPGLSLILHRLSCIMSCPPPEAWNVACAALTDAYEHREEGLTFGGAGLSPAHGLTGGLTANIDLSAPAPAELEAHSDATWGDRNVYALLLTFAGAAVLHQTKKIALLVDSSMESEAIGSSKAGEAISFAREILRAIGRPMEGPTFLSTDNLANQKVGSGTGHPTRARHFLRRYYGLKQRVASGEVKLVHVPDAEMPADFLTKWIPRSKLQVSLRYATNASMRSPTTKASTATSKVF